MLSRFQPVTFTKKSNLAIEKAEELTQHGNIFFISPEGNLRILLKNVVVVIGLVNIPAVLLLL